MKEKPQVTVSRHWLRVPAHEWAQIKYGGKREFRTVQPSLSLARVEKPTPVIVYRQGAHENAEFLLMILEDVWPEQLGAISDESLQAEGCDTLAEYKVRWTAQHRVRFNPLKRVYVHRVRPVTVGELDTWARKLFDRLYPEEVRGF